ncbi:VOC family protein [Nonomuraea antimicrobica]|uniref:VOC family protein n=1 Tax=Nonomuraea antimicrobica TaxID=561173 RepID=UPI0031E905D0
MPATSPQVADVQAVYARLRELGVTFTQGPNKGRVASTTIFDDTCGNLIQSVTQPRSTLS